MNKAELAIAVANKMNVTKKAAGEMIDDIISVVIDAVVTEGECVLPSIGKLKLVKVEETSGVALGKAWKKPAHNKVKLSLSVEGKTIGN